MLSKCDKTAALYIASLQAMAILHTRNHWTVSHVAAYGDHLMLERIYKSALENLDLAAEKFVGLFGPNCLAHKLQNELLSKVLNKYINIDEGYQLATSLAIEKDFLKFSQDAYKCFADEGKLSLGLDDMIMAIASTREEAVYLLKQSLVEKFKFSAESFNK